jgi:hypothetical protein
MPDEKPAAGPPDPPPGVLVRLEAPAADHGEARERVRRAGAELANGTYFPGGVGRRGKRPA